MTATELFAFFLATLIASVIPGPAIITAVATTMGRGLRPALVLMAGLTTGDLVYFIFAVLGLTTIAATFGELMIFIRYAGAAYLFYLGWSLITSKTENNIRQQIASADTSPANHAHNYLTGLFITLGNPKTMIFFMAVLPGVVDLQQVNPGEIVLLGTIIAALSFGCAFGYSVFALVCGRSVKQRIPTRWVNYTAGSALFGCGAAIATRD